MDGWQLTAYKIRELKEQNKIKFDSISILGCYFSLYEKGDLAQQYDAHLIFEAYLRQWEKVYDFAWTINEKQRNIIYDFCLQHCTFVDENINLYKN